MAWRQRFLIASLPELHDKRVPCRFSDTPATGCASEVLDAEALHLDPQLVEGVRRESNQHLLSITLLTFL